MTDNSTTPAGWYALPNDPATERYWDGTRWTEHHRPVGQSEVSPTPQPLVAPETKKPLWKKKRVLIPAGIFVLLVLVASLGDPPENDEPAAAEENAEITPTTSEEPSESEPTSTDDSVAERQSTTTEATTTTTAAPTIGADGEPLQVQFGEVASTSIPVDLPARTNEANCGLQVPAVVRQLPVVLTNAIGDPVGAPISIDTFGTWTDGSCVVGIPIVSDPAALTNMMTLSIGETAYEVNIGEIFGEKGASVSFQIPDFADPQPFRSGTLLVGIDVEPGIYTINPSRSCYWERLSGVSGDFEEIITNDNASDRTIVEIKATDFAFNSGCGPWAPYVEAASPSTSFTAGDWHVGVDIEPGLYRSDGEQGCYWERSSGFSHEFSEILANDNIDGPGIVEIRASDTRFSTGSGCGTWTKVE